MRKVITLFIVIAIISCFPLSAFAIGETGSGQSQVLAHVGSSFTITIPAIIDLSNGENVDVSISNAALEDNFAVRVYPQNTDYGAITLNHASGNDRITAYIRDYQTQNTLSDAEPIASFTSADLNGNSSATKYFIIRYDGLGHKPGNYTGTMEYRFELQPE